MNVDTSL